MFPQDVVNFTQFVPRKTGVFCELQRLKPKLRLVAIFVHMDMRRFIEIGTEESDAVAFDS